MSHTPSPSRDQVTDHCPICKRPYGSKMSLHHLRPITFRTRTKEVHDQGNQIYIHNMCHQKIHATFSEDELYKYYYTVERLLEHEEIQKFVKWVGKKDPDYYDKNDDTKARKKKRGR